LGAGNGRRDTGTSDHISGGEGASEPTCFGSKPSPGQHRGLQPFCERRHAVAKKQSGERSYKSYLEFLETAVASENMRKNDPQKWEECKKKLEKERFLVRMKVRK